MTILKYNKNGERVFDSYAGTGDFLAGYSDLLTVQEVSDITGLCDATIRKEIREGNLPGRSIGRQYFVPKFELRNFFAMK